VHCAAGRAAPDWYITTSIRGCVPVTPASARADACGWRHERPCRDCHRGLTLLHNSKKSCKGVCGWRAGDKALRELPSPGKSGSVFFISHDERFFIKTMRKGAAGRLLHLRLCAGELDPLQTGSA